MKLIIEDDEGRKTVVPLVREEVEITIGRQEGNTIRLTERNVSRRHAKLCRRNGSVVIEDIGSYNGVKVNGDKIDGQYEIKEGDLVQIGDYDLAIQYEEGARPSAGASSPAREQEAGPPAGVEEEASAPGDDENPTPRAKKSESTSIISPSQLKDSRARQVVDIPVEEAPRLVVIGAEFDGREFACIRNEIKIGRTDDNDVALDHRSLSRNHCKVVREDNGEWKIIDLQSSNGVQVNGEQYAQCVLHSGDTIELGHLKMRFLAPSDEASDFVDAGGKPKRKSGKTLPLIAGGAVLLAALAVGGYFLTRGTPAGKPPEQPVVDKGQGSAPGTVTPPTPNKQPDAVAVQPQQPPEPPKVETPAAPSQAALAAFEAGKAAMRAGRFAEAEKKLTLAAEERVEGADKLLAQARAELESAQHLDAASKAFAAKDLETARAELDAITEGSAVAQKASALRQKIAAAEQKIAAAEEKLQRQREQEEARKLADEERRRKLEEQQQQAQTQTPKTTPKQPPTSQGTTQEPPANPALADLAEGKRLASNSLKRYKEAIPFLERALAADPSLAEAHLYLGTCYARIENIKRGAYHYEEFVHARPKDPNSGAVRGILRDYFAQSGERPRWPLDEQ